MLKMTEIGTDFSNRLLLPDFNPIKEREQNKCRSLRGYFALILHFENPYVARLCAVFKAQTENKLSLSKICIYLIRVPKTHSRDLFF